MVGGIWLYRTTTPAGLTSTVVQPDPPRADKAKAAADAEAQRRAAEAEQQRLATAKAEEERKAKAAAEAEAEAKRKAEEAEQQRLAAAKAEQERNAKAVAEAQAKRKAQSTRVGAVPTVLSRLCERVTIWRCSGLAVSNPTRSSLTAHSQKSSVESDELASRCLRSALTGLPTTQTEVGSLRCS
jgi:hypothetical protein